ncbi:MAG TPA: hydroxylamine reductase [Spirochaetia bacterium]|nr:MAG: hydroxylamine reductase [Spirochaetes bacterium GWB1_36_13]HCL56975.1 hydroxylamine reductase [Spirochaetia bacterium]
MSMFCYQCQETAGNKGCTVRGVCGKTDSTANLQDLLLAVLRGISFFSSNLKELGVESEDKTDQFLIESTFTTITNANFDNQIFYQRIEQGLAIKKKLKDLFLKTYEAQKGKKYDGIIPLEAAWENQDSEAWGNEAGKQGVLRTENEDIRSLKELLHYGLKGMAAYAKHAFVLERKDKAVFHFMYRAMSALAKTDITADELVGLVLECGSVGVTTMALLDEANTSTYGHPEPTKVNIGVRNNPGILISGHDLKDMEELLIQTEGTGVDVYTHSEMLPANSYPAFKKYAHFAGNYGGSWWKQGEEFEKFNGPILMTTNCIIPVKDSYKGRIFTTGVSGYEGVKHIQDRIKGKMKDFSEIIALAKTCQSPVSLEEGFIMGGFARNTVLSVADKVIDLVKQGKIKKFVVMGGCDGRHPSRNYYTDFAKALPKDTVILTAGCAKYRYNKLNLGEIEGIPRVLDAGQCNDSYSLAYIALKLQEALGLDDINQLPIAYNIAWYEQKAVLVLLALLSLGVKKIHLGPTLPAFVSPNILKVLVEKFEVAPSASVDADIKTLI